MESVRSCRALVVGIDDYRGGIARLQSANADARAVAATLADDHGYQVSCLTDAEASSAAVLAALAREAREVGPEQGFLFYFAGHGLAMGDGDSGPQGFLLAQDAQPGDESTWISMQTLREALASLPCRHLLVVLDCCFAGAFRWSATRDAVLVGHPLYDSQLARYLEGDAWVALTSASHDQRAADSLPGRRNTRDGAAAGQHSPFAAAFLDGLAGAADSARRGFQPDGVVTATELYQYVFERLVPADARAAQTPGLWPLRADNRGEYVFRCPGVELRTLPDPPLDDAHNPWLGLRAYGPADAPLFFGREQVIEQLASRLGTSLSGNLLVVVGASGSGKSSVVRAGLLPRMLAVEGQGADAQPAWRLVECERLRSDPRQQLAQAEARMRQEAMRPGRPLLLIDQFEELYTQARDPEHREAFLKALEALLDAPEGPLVVLTLRSDFEPRLAACERFAHRLRAARFVVPPFSPAELRRVIEGPLQARALFLDPPELVDTLLDEVAAMPGALPLLSFALAETYRIAQARRRRDGSADRALTEADYAATGGVVGGLHRRATEIHDQADPALRAMIRRLFLRMVSSEGARLARRRVSLDELRFEDEGDTARAREAIDRYVAARLLIVDEGYVEPAHDSLVLAWELLQEWLAGAQEQPLMRAVWRSARDWEAGRFGSGLLWHGDPRLPQALQLMGEMNLLERRFIQRSRWRRNRERRLFVIGALSIIAVLAVAAVFSMERAEEADRQRQAALEQLAEAQHANGKALVAQAERAFDGGDYMRAAFDSAAAFGFRHFGIAPEADPALAPPELILPHKPERRQAIGELTRALQRAPLALAWRALGYARMSADGRRLVGIAPEGLIEVRDFASEAIARLPAVQGRITGLGLSPDGRWLALSLAGEGEGKPPPRLWLAELDSELALRSQRMLPAPGGRSIEAMAFDARGRWLATAGFSTLAMWTLDHADSPPHVFDVPRSDGRQRLRSLHFDDAAGRLLVGGHQDSLLVADLASLREGRWSARPLGPRWEMWSENLQKGDYVRAVLPWGEAHLLMASANRLLMGQWEGDELRFAAQPIYQTRREITHLALHAEGGLAAVVHAEGVSLVAPGAAGYVAMHRPLRFTPASLTVAQIIPDHSLMLLASADSMELVDIAPILSRDHELPDLGLAESLPPAQNVAALRALHDSGALDLLALAFPDPEARPAGLQMLVDDREDGLVVDFSAPDSREGFDGIVDVGSMRVALREGDDPLVAIAMDRFHKRQLRPGNDPEIEVYRLSDLALVSVRAFYELDAWGIDRFRFSDDGSRLLVSVSNFDGYEHAAYALPMDRPDLTRYANPPVCQSPFNLPRGHMLAKTRLLECP